MQDKSSRTEDGGKESLSRPANPPVCFAGLVLNLDACTLARDSGDAITLTRSEFRLLRLFVSRPGRVLSRDAILDAFTDRRFEPFDRSVDVLVSKLRRKIEPDPKEPRLIVTVPGEGYRFDALLRGATANSATAFDTQASAEPVGTALMDPRSAKAPEGLPIDERHLAAILAANVAGYSRLMGRNEAATMRELEAHQAVILPLIAKQGGSIVDIAGDDIVAQFPSAVRAVECAVAMQKAMAERNSGVPAGRRMLLRIGVDLGDIIHDTNRSYGDGINVAARLEPFAKPGSICVSADVRDAIFGKLSLALRDIGEKSLKNIERPVHIYQIQEPETRARRDWLGAGSHQYRRLAPALLGLIALLVGVAGVVTWRFWPGEMGRPDYTPIITVLPFTNAGNDANVDSLGPSLAREISAMLSTYPRLKVFSASGTSERGAQDLGRRYALDGDFLRSGDKLRVRARLTNAASSETLWSDSYDFESEDPIAVQKKTAERVYGVLAGGGGRLGKIEQEAAWRKPESALTEGDYALRAWAYGLKGNFDDNIRARKIFEEGLKRFPDSASLKLGLAWTYLLESDEFGCYENYRETIEIAYRLGREVEEAKNKSRSEIYDTRFFMAKAYAWHGEHFDRAIDEAEAAIATNPYDASDRAQLSFYLANAGQYDKALEWVSWAVAHDYQDFFWVKANTAWTYYLAGRYEDALQVLKGVEATHSWPVMMIYVQLGRFDEAKAAAAEWLKTGPHSVFAETCVPIREPMKQKYLNDLRKAGVPERAVRASP
jgi:adenylate cyclase